MLYSQLVEPQPTYSTCQQMITSSENLEYQEDMEHHKFQNWEPSRTTELPLRPPKPYGGAEPSWNPLEHRVTRYDPGFAGFAPLSPSESLLNGAPPSPPEDSKLRSPKVKASSTRIIKSKKGKAKGTLEWEHIVVRKGGLERVCEHVQKEASQKSFGCRKGKLQPEVKEKARRVRKLGACWPCWVLKVPVSHQYWIIWYRSTDLRPLNRKIDWIGQLVVASLKLVN
jgi:hypothetical protein